VPRSSKRKKRAIITGGAGFIGSHLAEALLADGHQVTAIDNLSTGRPENVEQVLGDPGFELVLGDVADAALLDRHVAGSDVVFHLAAAVGVRLILADPIQSFKTNVLGTESVLNAAARHDAKVLIASTSEVYGKVARTPQQESDDVLLGATSYSRWSYAACKMLDEFIGLAYARRGLPVVVFRLFNTVGPRQTGAYGMVVPRFVHAALRSEALHVHGDGSQSRCFLHVSDAVEAILRLERSTRAVGDVFNIGSTESVTILELAERVLAAVDGHGWNGLADKPSRSLARELIVLTPYEDAFPAGGFEDIRCREPAIEKIRRVTRWVPKRTLEDILRDVIADQARDLETAPEYVPVGAVA